MRLEETYNAANCIWNTSFQVLFSHFSVQLHTSTNIINTCVSNHIYKLNTLQVGVSFRKRYFLLRGHWKCLKAERPEKKWIRGKTKFDVGRSVHHHTIQINQPTRCNSFTSFYLTFMCRSTCFGCLHTHHQELTIVLTASGFLPLERGGSSVKNQRLLMQL